MNIRTSTVLSRAAARVGADAAAPPKPPGILEDTKNTTSNIIWVVGIGVLAYFGLTWFAPTFIGAAGKTARASRSYRDINKDEREAARFERKRDDERRREESKREAREAREAGEQFNEQSRLGSRRSPYQYTATPIHDAELMYGH